MKLFFFVGCFASFSLLAQDLVLPEPWLTGPLISPTGEVVPVGHFVVQPYVFVTVETGEYTSHWHCRSLPNFTAMDVQLSMWVGLTSWMDLFVFPETVTNGSQGASATGFGDLPVGLEFQLVKAKKEGWAPGVKVSLTETFPTGTYDRLSEGKRGTDASGEGAWFTTGALVFYKMYVLGGHDFTSTLSFQYAAAPPVRVKGLSYYGGDAGTNGKVRPGNLFTAIYGFEYSLTQNWAFAMDSIYIHEDRSSFSGATTVAVGFASSEQVSLSPAVEYNFSDRLGILVGTWVTAFGRNSVIFRSGIISLEYTY